jgi:transcription initiation factor TFIIIB Brf1 subunit/transcription initiation factor TFIIB
MEQAKKFEVAVALLAMMIAGRNIELTKVRRNIGQLAHDLGFKKEEVEEVAKEALHKAIEISLTMGKKKDKKTDKVKA